MKVLIETYPILINEDGGGTLWRWVYHCQARIVADLNKPVLQVTATPENLKKLEWVIRQMFKVFTLPEVLLKSQDSESDEVDVTALRVLGKFDAPYFLPVIARLSSTYLEVSKNQRDEVSIVFGKIARLIFSSISPHSVYPHWAKNDTGLRPREGWCSDLW